MLRRAAEEQGIDLAASWMIGDGLNDIEAGKAAGCRTVLVTRLKIEQVERFLSVGTPPDRIVATLDDALSAIGPAHY